MDEIHLNLPRAQTELDRFKSPRSHPTLYPGTRPSWSFCFTGDRVLPVRVQKGRFEVMTRRDTWRGLDDFLSERTGLSLHQRYAVLAVGSNGCPARLADEDKYAHFPSVAIPVFRGIISGLVSVYAPRMAVYRSVPATVMGAEGARSELWLTLLTPGELEQMDMSEGRGARYDLLDLPEAEFIVDKRVSVHPLCAYAETHGLADPATGQPILLSCFRTTGPDLTRMSQTQVQHYVDEITRGKETMEEKTRFLSKHRNVKLPLPAHARRLDTGEPPSRTADVRSVL